MKRIVGSMAAALFIAQAATASLAGIGDSSNAQPLTLSTTSEQLLIDSSSLDTSADAPASNASLNTNFSPFLPRSTEATQLPEGDLPTPIPEPATLGLIVLFGSGLLTARRFFA